MGDVAAAERRVDSGGKWFVLPLQLLPIHMGEDTAPSGQGASFLLSLGIAPKPCFSSAFLFSSFSQLHHHCPSTDFINLRDISVSSSKGRDVGTKPALGTVCGGFFFLHFLIKREDFAPAGVSDHTAPTSGCQWHFAVSHQYLKLTVHHPRRKCSRTVIAHTLLVLLLFSRI